MSAPKSYILSHSPQASAVTCTTTVSESGTNLVVFAVAFEPQWLFALNAIKLWHVAIDIAFDVCLSRAQIRASLGENSPPVLRGGLFGNEYGKSDEQ